MKSLYAIAGGLAGACALTALHQIVKEKNADAPRMDLLGMESLTKMLQKFDADIPNNKKLYYATMAGDVISNALFYSLAGVGKKKVMQKGAALGLAAGVGAVFLPKPLGLNQQHSNRTPQTQAMAIGYYLGGGLVSSAVMLLLNRVTKSKTEKISERLL